MFCRPVLLAFALLTTVRTESIGRTAESPSRVAWQQLAGSRYREARESFRLLRKDQPGFTRESLIGEAISLLNLQPATTSNREEARRICTEVAAGASDDSWTAQARFFLGRIAEIHSIPADFSSACSHYRWIIDHQPASELGQASIVKFAILQLGEPIPADEINRRYAQLVELEPLLESSSARRDFHLVMADACLHQELGLEPALRHSLAAESAGVQQPMRAATVLLRIAKLSRHLGLTDQSRRYYLRFLNEAGKNDYRAKLVRERLAALTPEAGP